MDFVLATLTMLAAVNPPAVALARSWLIRGGDAMVRAVTGGVVAAGGLAAVSGLGEPFLDFLGVQPETFRIAAGIVLLASGAMGTIRVQVLALEGDGSWRDAISPLAIPAILTPAAAAAAISQSADDGIGTAIGAAIIAVAAGSAFLLLGDRPWRALLDGVARLLGALLCAFGVALIVDGVRAI
jgi:small neutral amino acid transporter SnatA (MarC family)